MKPNNNDISKYKSGDKVFAKANPNESLIVRRYIDRIYYCRFSEDDTKKELALFEREIVGN